MFGLIPESVPVSVRIFTKLLGEKIPVIGVAKTKFNEATHAVPVLRGPSHRPLYVTAVGIKVAIAAEHVESMHGRYRIPTLLKKVDVLCRNPKCVWKC